MGDSRVDPSAHAWESWSDSAGSGGVWPGWRTTAVLALTSAPHLPSHALLPSTGGTMAPDPSSLFPLLARAASSLGSQ